MPPSQASHQFFCLSQVDSFVYKSHLPFLHYAHSMIPVTSDRDSLAGMNGQTPRVRNQGCSPHPQWRTPRWAAPARQKKSCTGGMHAERSLRHAALCEIHARSRVGFLSWTSTKVDVCIDAYTQATFPLVIGYEEEKCFPPFFILTFFWPGNWRKRSWMR